MVGGIILKTPEYLRRLFNVPQMDLDYTFWQMINLCISPSRVYRTTKYHKQTKNQWARDDPAFLFVLMIFMMISTFAYSICFHHTGFGSYVKAVVYAVCIDFLLVGVIVSTVNWYVANTYLRIESGSSGMTTDQHVEWLYAFDVHCNSFFPLFMILYVVQYFGLFIFLRDGFPSLFFANLMYAASISYYCYITFLGFDVLPFLQHTLVFLYPIALVIIALVLFLIFKINISQLIMKSYFD